MKVYDLEALRKQVLATHLNAQQMAWESNDFAIFKDITDLSFAETSTRLDMAVFGLCQEGECDVLIDMQSHHVQAGNYLILLPQQVVSLASTQQPLQGIFICLSETFYTTILQRVQTSPLLLYIRQHPTAALQTADIAWITQYHTLIFNEMGNMENVFRTSTAKALLAAFFYKVCNLYEQQIMIGQKGRTPAVRSEEIFTQFVQLLQESFKQERSLSFYADKLFITPKYLSSVVKQISGESANKWIQSYVMKEAKILLLNTHLNIQQIANYLNFPSQSFFGKYFKEHTGLSPHEFRKQREE